MLLNNQWIEEEIKEIIKDYLETNENENNFSKFMGYSKSTSKKKVYNSTGLPQQTRKSQINNLNLHSKELEKKIQSNRKEIIKIRMDINETEILKNNRNNQLKQELVI